MKATFSAVCATALVVAASAVAGTRTSATIRPESLARIEAITSYCKQADQASSALYQARLAEALRGRSEIELQRDRGTDAYLRSFAQAQETLSGVSDRTGASGCAEFLANRD